MSELFCRDARTVLRGRTPTFLLLFCLLGSTVLSGQEASFRHLTVRHGLSHGAVHTILQDSRGFMWFGTADGLNRFDGRRIEILRHQPSEPNSLSSSSFGKALEDRNGILWLATWGGGLNRFDPKTETFTRYRHDRDDPTSLSQDRIEVLHEDSAGVLWVGTEQSGLNRFDEASQGFLRYRNDPEDPTSLGNDDVKALCEDREGLLWVGTNFGLSRFDRDTETFVRYTHDPRDPASLASDRVRAIVEDGDGYLWIGTRGGGLDRFDRSSGVFEHFRHDDDDPASLSDDSISRLFVDSEATLWIGTYNGGLNRYEPSTGTFAVYRFDPGNPGSLSHDRVEAIYEDRSRNLWIGTRGGGVDRLDLKEVKFRSYTYTPGDPASLPHPSVRSIAGDAGRPGEAFWIGTDGGLVWLDTTRGELRRYHHDRGEPTSLSSERIWSLLVDRLGRLWVGTYESGLNLVRRENGRLRSRRFRHDPAEPASLRSDRVQALFEDVGGTIWIGTTAGLHRAVPLAAGSDEMRFEVVASDSPGPMHLSGDYVITIRQDRAGALWIGTRNGLNRLLPEQGVAESFHHDPARGDQGLSSNYVQALHVDERRESTLWIGTEGGGLNRLDTGTGEVRRYLVEDGLAGNVVDAILQDASGFLWISTSSGLSRFDPDRETFKLYDRASGLANHSFVRNAAWKSTRGELFFGGLAGLTSFNPSRLQDNPVPPLVEIVSVKVFNEEVKTDLPLSEVRELELDWRESFITLEVAALEYTAPEDNLFAYYLEGIDPGWVEAGRRPLASYAHLEPGEYVFHVKAANSDRVWNENPRTLKIVVTPPYHQTWWFRGSVFVLALALVTAAVRWRLVAIRRRTEELERMNEVLRQQMSERERAEADRELLIAKLQAKNAEMERFAHTVSHDLKSPLVTITGFMGFLRQDVGKGDLDRFNEDARQIERAAEKMYDFVNDLLEMSRLGEAVKVSREMSMSELAAEAAELVAGRLSERGRTHRRSPRWTDLGRVRGPGTRFDVLLHRAATGLARSPSSGEREALASPLAPQARDAERLSLAGSASFEAYLRAGDAKRRGEEAHQLLVGGPVDRGRRDADLEPAVMDAREGAFRGPGDGEHLEQEAAVGLAEDLVAHRPGTLADATPTTTGSGSPSSDPPLVTFRPREQYIREMRTPSRCCLEDPGGLCMHTPKLRLLLTVLALLLLPVGAFAQAAEDDKAPEHHHHAEWAEVGHEVRQAVREALDGIPWDEIREEIRHEVDGALEEVDWDEIRDEIRREVDEALEEVDWDEIHAEVGEEIRRAMDEVDWDEIREAREEVRRALAEVDFAGIGAEVNAAIREAMAEVDVAVKRKERDER